MDIEQNFQYPITHLRKFVHYLTIKELRNLRLVSREFNHCIENELYEFNFTDSIQPINYGVINKFSNLQIIHLPKTFEANFQLDYVNPNSVNTLIYKYVHFKTNRAEEINSQFPNLRRLKYPQQKTCLQINENIPFYNQILELSLERIHVLCDHSIIFACPQLEKLSISIGYYSIIQQLIQSERSPRLKGLKLIIEQQEMDHQKFINLLDEYFQMLDTLQILQFNVKVTDRQIRQKYLKLICSNKYITHLYLRKLFFEEYSKLQFNRRLKWIGVNFNYEYYPQFHQAEQDSDADEEEDVENNDSEGSPNNSEDIIIDEQPQVLQQQQLIELQNQNRETTETPEILDFSRNDYKNKYKQNKIEYDEETVKKGWESVTNAIRPSAHTQLILNNQGKSYIKYQHLEVDQYIDLKFLEPFAKKFL